MAKNAITKTVGLTEVTFTETDLTVKMDQYVAVADDGNTGDIWVNMDPNGTTTSVQGDNHVSIRPGEPVPFSNLPLKVISSTGGNSLTVGPV